MRLAKDFGYLSIERMLSEMSSDELRKWEAFYYIESGGYDKAQKKKSLPLAMKAAFGTLKKKGKNG